MEPSGEAIYVAKERQSGGMKQNVLLGISVGWKARLGLAFSLALMAASGFPAMPQETAKEAQVKSLDDVVALISKEEARDLDKKGKQEDAARAISAHLHQALIGKEATLEMTLEWWRPWTAFRGFDYQLKPAVGDFRVGGVRFQLHAWVYLLAASGPDLQKLKKGDRFKVTGKFENAQVTVSEGPRLLINLVDAMVVPK